MPDVIVKKSKIEGKGIFAARDFKKGEIVLRWHGKQLTSGEVKKLPERDKKYVSYSGRKYFFQQSPERFVNHSCDPNTKVGDLCDIATKDIKKGEEITSDYSKDLIPGFKMKCLCGSVNCKQIISRKVK